MKLSWGFILSSIYCSASASSVGRVFVHDSLPRASPQSPPTVSPETARLILAQRLGVSRFHSIKDADSTVVEQLNAFGGLRPRLFGSNDASRNQAHVLVWVEGVEDASDLISDPSAWSGEFAISSPPPASDNDRLIQDIILQAESLPKHPDPQSKTYMSGIDVEMALKPIKPNVHNEYLSVLRADKTDKKSVVGLSNKLTSLLRQTAAAEDGFSMTVVLMPPSSSHSKRSAHPYGTYGLPSSMGGRRQKTEAPLTLESTKPSSSPQSPNPNISDLEDFPVIAQAQGDDTPLLGILPKCFETQQACEKQTHNCTGHGSCGVLHKGSSQSQTKDCYGCVCKPTIKHVGEDKGMESKRDVTYWGGPACQKRDISVPFWLFVGTGVLLAFVISSGIGLLYSIGSEELPSVIGAEVSGPQRK